MLDSVVYYETMDECWEVSKRLNNVQGNRISTCVPTSNFKDHLEELVDRVVIP